MEAEALCILGGEEGNSFGRALQFVQAAVLSLLIGLFIGTMTLFAVQMLAWNWKQKKSRKAMQQQEKGLDSVAVRSPVKTCRCCQWVLLQQQFPAAKCNDSCCVCQSSQHSGHPWWNKDQEKKGSMHVNTCTHLYTRCMYVLCNR